MHAGSIIYVQFFLIFFQLHNKCHMFEERTSYVSPCVCLHFFLHLPQNIVNEFLWRWSSFSTFKTFGTMHIHKLFNRYRTYNWQIHVKMMLPEFQSITTLVLTFTCSIQIHDFIDMLYTEVIPSTALKLMAEAK